MTKVIDSLTKLAREVRESPKIPNAVQKGEFVNKTEHTVIHKQMEIVKVLAESDPEVWLRIKKERFQKTFA